MYVDKLINFQIVVVDVFQLMIKVLKEEFFVDKSYEEFLDGVKSFVVGFGSMFKVFFYRVREYEVCNIYQLDFENVYC